MELRPLGRTGLQVSTLCLGAFGGWGNEDPRETDRVVAAALEAGINFMDTSDSYGNGASEEVIGRALSGGRRDQVVLATKFSKSMGDDPNQGGLSRRWIVQAVEGSLRRLRTDWIDLYQIHRLPPVFDVHETLGALSDLIHAGKVRSIGTATFPAHRIVEAQWVARDRGLERFVTEQSPYSLLGAEADVFGVCERYGVGCMAWSPLAGGWLSGRYRKDRPAPRSVRIAILPESYDPDLPANRRKLEAADAFARLADDAGLSLIEMAIGFALEHRAVASAIVGARTMEHLGTYLRACDTHLSSDVLDRIDEIVAPGTNVNPDDPGWRPPELSDPGLRRRSG
jgi:aryl-alcohol dehydrogenase-like predicted oxidoreductase